ncbi:MAG: IclR family transcriptional regulator [Alphaproteobacteria bacterium]
MKRPEPKGKSAPKTTGRKERKRNGLAGSQTLVRGLDVVEAVASGATNLAALAEALALNRSTVHRLAATLVEHRYLTFAPRVGYALGPKLVELGHMARDQMSFPRVARDFIETLAASTGDTVHLGILDDTRALYLDKIAGSRRVEIRSRIGDRHPLRSTGLGKALILDQPEGRWRELYEAESRDGRHYAVPLNAWVQRMRAYAKADYALDLEENEDRIRCVAAPVRDATDKIIGAISVSSAAQYMDDSRMETLADEVRSTARAISRAMGWREGASPPLRLVKRA